MTEFSRTVPEFQRQFLAVEPDFGFLASYGETIIPTLEELLAGEDELLAIRAVYVAGLLERSAGLPLLEHGATDPRPPVRVAVAGALRLSIPVGENDAGKLRQTHAILQLLLADHDPSVRRWASKTVGTIRMASLKELLTQLISNDIEASVRAAASESLRNMGKNNG